MLRWIVLFCGFICSAFRFTDVGLTELQFQVLRNDDAVGTLTIAKVLEADRTTYTLSSDVLVDLVYTIQVSEKISDVFRSGVLQTSSHQRHINGTCRARHLLTQQGDTYQIVNDQNRIRTLSGPIQSSVVSIYFHEPAESMWVYSQNFQKMVFMEKTGQHCFRITLPNGNVSNYTYQGGVVKEVVTNTFIGTLRFVYQSNLFAK